MSPKSTLLIEDVRQDAIRFSVQDRLLNFSPNGENLSPLILSSSDFFYTKWVEKKAPLSLAAFFPTSANLTAAQKEVAVKKFRETLKEKKEDFCDTDLYLALGFLKYDENALAPALLIPLETDSTCNLLQISNRRPLENVLLKRKIENIAVLPKATDAIVNGVFDIKLYFEKFEKAVAGKYNWKFTKNGICLTLVNSVQVLMMKNFLHPLWKRAEICNRDIFSTLLGEKEFPNTDSIFEEIAYDNYYNPAEHFFLHTLDSRTNKAVIDAQNENAAAYAIQALPGSEKFKAAANLAADLIAKDKKVLVISRRAITKQAFVNALLQKKQSNESDREQILKNFCKIRKSLVSYYDTVNKQLQPSNTTLSVLLQMNKDSNDFKFKIPQEAFSETASLDYEQFKSMQARLEKISHLYFEEGGLDVCETFKEVKKTYIKSDDLYTIRDDLKATKETTKIVCEIAEAFQKTGLYPSGITLDELSEIIRLAQTTFDEKTPEFEDWNLHAPGWDAYQDEIKNLPSAGSKWVNYRRQTSDIYTDSAIDENVFESREIIESNKDSALKGLSDQYRKAKKHLLSVFKNPQNIHFDTQLLEGIDNLIKLQENRRGYKDCTVLGNHLLGKDWLYEKSNWAFLTLKIRYFYDFKNKFKGNPQIKTLTRILEQWHLIKPVLKNRDNILSAIAELKRALENISATLDLEKPIESESIKSWSAKIPVWTEKWNSIDILLQLNKELQDIEGMNCKQLAQFLKNTESVFREIPQSFACFWSSTQIQKAIEGCPDLLSISPSERHQKSNDFRTLQKELCEANALLIQEKLSGAPALLNNTTLAHSFELTPRESYDVALFLDADCTSIAEAMPGIMLSKRAVFIGDPQLPSQELFNDASEAASCFALSRSVLSQLLRKCAPTREIGFTGLYADASLVEFANERIYARKIKQLPSTSRQLAKRTFLKDVTDKVSAIASAAVNHAEKKPHQSLGIIAFNQETCKKIAEAIQALPKSESAAKFLSKTTANAFYIKTPEKAVQKYRDVIIVCNDIEGAAGAAGEQKLAVCTTLATKKMYLVASKADLAMRANAKPGLIWDWIASLNDSSSNDITQDARPAESKLGHEVANFLEESNVKVNEYISCGGIPVGPVIEDSSNSKHYLAVIEDDCTTCPYRESVEDREIIRYNILNQLGWKIINVRLPLWRLSNTEEKMRLLSAIEKAEAKEKQVQADTADEDEDFNCSEMTTSIVPYEVVHPKIDGTQHDKPIAELTPAQLIIQLKFYVDHESPIHEEILMRRILELHHIERPGPIVRKTLNDAIRNALLQQKFTKTGSFLYAIGEPRNIVRDRSSRPDYERKLAYVSPEEQALLLKADKQNINELLGLL